MNNWMVRAGHAVAYRRFSTEYVPAERRAQEEKIGIWQGEFVLPWDWRQGQRIDSATPARNNRCDTENGQIYHLPGQRFYNRTRISPQAGERWFCSEEEARAAGWRRARQ